MARALSRSMCRLAALGVAYSFLYIDAILCCCVAHTQHIPSLPYVDDNGEEDVGLRRGRPLYLDQGRIQHLYRLWAQHLTAREVVRERVMRERVIREAYY